MANKHPQTQYRCSFCGKSQNQVQRLISGPGGVYICDECIELCREIIEEEKQKLIIEEEKQQLQKEELKPLEEWVEDSIEKPSAIIRNVTLPQEYQPIGFSLISYFAKVLQYIYPNMPTKCHLEVNSHSIRFFIRTGEENKAKVEKILSDYGLVLQNKLLPQQFLASPEQVYELQKLLSMTGLALRSFSAVEKRCDTPEPNETESVEDKVMRLQNALGWVFRRELEDVEDVFV
jgi:hypothetical protein